MRIEPATSHQENVIFIHFDMNMYLYVLDLEIFSSFDDMKIDIYTQVGKVTTKREQYVE